MYQRCVVNEMVSGVACLIWIKTVGRWSSSSFDDHRRHQMVADGVGRCRTAYLDGRIAWPTTIAMGATTFEMMAIVSPRSAR